MRGRLVVYIRKKVHQLASRRSLSNGNEPEEFTDLIAAFEAQNKCKITLQCSLELHKGYLDTRWSLRAHNASENPLEAQSLGLANVWTWAGDYLTFMALLTQLLYALDFQLAENEFAAVAHKKA